MGGGAIVHRVVGIRVKVVPTLDIINSPDVDCRMVLGAAVSSNQRVGMVV